MTPTTIHELKEAGLVIGDLELSDKGRTWLRALDQISTEVIGVEHPADDLILSTFALIR